MHGIHIKTLHAQQRGIRIEERLEMVFGHASPHSDSQAIAPVDDVEDLNTRERELLLHLMAAPSLLEVLAGRRLGRDKPDCGFESKVSRVPLKTNPVEQMLRG